MADLFARYRVIDTDSHVTEPADLWTSRVPARHRERVPHVRRVNGRDMWFIGDEVAGGPGFYSMAGFDGTLPDSPATFEEIPPACTDAGARLAHLDAESIHAQVIYPNVGGFGSGRFLALGDPELMLTCVRAYNDWLLEWTSADPNRLIPVMALPFWDIPAAVKEMERCAELGHRAVLACGQPQAYGQPPLAHGHWDPLWDAAQSLGLPVSFHIGSGDLSELVRDSAGIGIRANFARLSSLYFLDNSRTLADLIFGGVCHRFPKLRFVSVESGAGWIHSMLEAFDWQWQNGGVRDEHPEYDLLPSEYFRRQIYGCFWFERGALREVLEAYPENLLFETDFPHPTCQAPGPKSAGTHPREYAEEALAGLPEPVVARVLHDNAAALYGVA